MANKSEREQAMTKLRDKMNQMLDGLDQTTKMLEEKTALAKETIETEMEKAQKRIDDLQAKGAELKTKAYENWDRLQNSLADGLDKAQSNLIEVLDQHDQKQLEKYIDVQIEYAARCTELAELASEEAKLAFLDAAKASREYEERYGEE